MRLVTTFHIYAYNICMPELPEVETVRRGLTSLLVGHKVLKVTHDTPKGFPNAPADVEQFLIGAEVKTIRRRAKVLIIDLSTEYSLVIHLKNDGQLVYVRKSEQSSEQRVMSHEGDAETKSHDSKLMPHASRSEANLRFGAGHPNDSLVGKLPDRSTRVIFELDNNATSFLTIKGSLVGSSYCQQLKIPNIDFMKKVGPEPLEQTFTSKEFIQRLERRRILLLKLQF